MADLPIVPDALRPRRARRALQEADVGRHASCSSAPTSSGSSTRRRRARGRADLRLHLREGRREEAGRAPVAVVDDERRDEGGVRRTCAPGADLKPLEEAARSRSEADWIVGMNATRAATIRLRSSFDGAVSLGRVQTPTLAILARREEEIRAFMPEPYWLVDAVFAADGRAGLRGPLPRRRAAAGQDGRGGRRGRRGRPRPARRDHEAREDQAHGEGAAPLRPHVACSATPTRASGSPRGARSARRSGCYEEHKALTYPRTNSRYLSTDMVDELKPIAAFVGQNREYTKAADFVTSLDQLPLERVVNNEKVTDHHAIIPTRAEHKLDKMSSDDQRVYDLVARRFLAIFHPDAQFENTRVETTVAGHVFRTRGKVLLVPGWRGVYGELAEGEQGASDEDEGRDQQLPEARARRGRRDPQGRVARARDQAAAPLLRRVAARRDGDRRQARRRGGAARGDEGLGDRHAGHARVDHRAAHRRGLRRARRPRAGRDREGPERRPAAGRAPADVDPT